MHWLMLKFDFYVIGVIDVHLKNVVHNTIEIKNKNKSMQKTQHTHTHYTFGVCLVNQPDRYIERSRTFDIVASASVNA